ncbi:MAG TPA: glycosyltransferase family 4 protein [Candidatus Binatia bacterium]|jgi:glycosyltransferase involved in cell wall biosynthesis|nr:glycosyltransferase family 4 protein [Candidatus Binatia bacterium]
MSRPLKFLHLTTFYPPYSFGGDAMYIYRLAHALGDAGHHVDVVHCVDAYHLLHPAEPQMSFADHPHVIRHELRSGYGWLSPLLTQQTGRSYLKRKAIRALLNSKKYDVVHYHNISLLGPEIMTLQPERGCVVKMYTTHEHWLICPTHVLWKFNRRPCEKPECLRCTILAKRPPQIWRYNGMLARASQHIDQFVSPSRFTAQMHAERGFPQPVEHLPYFIDRVDDDWKVPGPRPQQNPYFLFVGRLEAIKGLQTVIELWKKVERFELLIAGTGTYERTLRAQAGSNRRIKFLGAISQRDLGALYFHALACIVPSITYETFGMVNIESFARKTPVIARDLGALPEVIADSNGGFVYRTQEELLAAIQRIAASPALRSRLGENGYAAFIKSWSKEAHMELYFDLLEKIAIRKLGYVPWERERQKGEQVSAPVM